MIKEFKEFALKGSMLDLAVGIIIGAAFSAVINSLVKDIIMPPIGLLFSGINFADLFISLNGTQYPNLAAAQAAGAPTINYGTFINTIISFLIVALVLFLIIRQINRMKRQPPAPEPNTKECPYCFTTIPLQASRCPACTSELVAQPSTD
ncbi:MAG: large conductance mechanosensitive channel protein MscL [Chloroflexi bacterium]|nr:large conductance mechanosensitive channel protein MscL [Chloroflexota bacterium]